MTEAFQNQTLSVQQLNSNRSKKTKKVVETVVEYEETGVSEDGVMLGDSPLEWVSRLRTM
jgi:hypothetical protein